MFRQRLEAVSTERGAVGAVSSRIHFAVNNLSQQKLAIKEAESQIIDADIAAETADSVRLRILQQSSLEVMKQANLQPERLVSLLIG